MHKASVSIGLSVVVLAALVSACGSSSSGDAGATTGAGVGGTSSAGTTGASGKSGAGTAGTTSSTGGGTAAGAAGATSTGGAAGASGSGAAGKGGAAGAAGAGKGGASGKGGAGTGVGGTGTGVGGGPGAGGSGGMVTCGDFLPQTFGAMCGKCLVGACCKEAEACANDPSMNCQACESGSGLNCASNDPMQDPLVKALDACVKSDAAMGAACFEACKPPPPLTPQCTGIALPPMKAPSKGACAAMFMKGTPLGCNPVTNEGCTGMGDACDLGQDKMGYQGYSCFAAPPANDTPLCQACDNAAGPFCVPGAHCVGTGDMAMPTQCAAYCCDDTDCGGGTCVKGIFKDPAVDVVGVCVMSTSGMGGAGGAGAGGSSAGAAGAPAAGGAAGFAGAPVGGAGGAGAGAAGAAGAGG